MYKIKINYIDNTEDNLILGDSSLIIILAKIAKILANIKQQVVDIKIEILKEDTRC
jgi:tRNA A-37 threonylcarbamoyl transferase component Bud32